MKKTDSKALTTYTITTYTLALGIFVFLKIVDGESNIVNLLLFLAGAFALSYPIVFVYYIKVGESIGIIISLLFAILGVVWIFNCLLLSLILLFVLGGS